MKEGPDLQKIEFNAQVIVNLFPEDNDIWNFKWLPKSPTNIWYKGPHRYSIDQDLQEFDSKVDIYGIWEGIVSNVINQILEGINKWAEKKTLIKRSTWRGLFLSWITYEDNKKNIPIS